MTSRPSTFDAEADAAYVPVAPTIRPGEARENVVIERLAGTVVLDFDEQGHLLGIGVLGARSLLSQATIESLTMLR